MSSTVSNRRVSGGFTLVELLVVVTIIGILIALLLPAVQAAREAARRMECSTHLKQLAQAATTHEAALHYLPAGGWGSTQTGDPQYGNDWRQPGGWVFNLLPYIEAQALHDLQLGKAAGQAHDDAVAQLKATPLTLTNCPSRRAATALANSKRAETDYAGNGGEVFQGFNNGGSNMAGPSDPTLWYYQGTVDPGRAGWNRTVTPQTGVFYGASQTTFSDIKDGASNTYLFAEKYLDPNAYTGGTPPDAGDEQSQYTGCQDDICRWVGSGKDPNYAPHQDSSNLTGYNTWYTFGSAHSSGFNAAMCDSSVRSISYTIDLETHRRLGNRSDGQAIDASKL
jgi:prepilin-type N-terminal cleavage/methylation domain-containing protein